MEPRAFKSTLEGHSDDVNCLAISSNGKLAVSGSADNTVRCVFATITNITTKLVIS